MGAGTRGQEVRHAEEESTFPCEDGTHIHTYPVRGIRAAVRGFLPQAFFHDGVALVDTVAGSCRRGFPGDGHLRGGWRHHREGGDPGDEEGGDPHRHQREDCDRLGREEEGGEGREEGLCPSRAHLRLLHAYLHASRGGSDGQGPGDVQGWSSRAEDAQDRGGGEAIPESRDRMTEDETMLTTRFEPASRKNVDRTRDPYISRKGPLEVGVCPDCHAISRKK